MQHPPLQEDDWATQTVFEYRCEPERRDFVAKHPVPRLFAPLLLQLVFETRRQAILQQWKAAARSFQRAAALCRSAGQKSLWHRLWCPNKQPHHLFCHHNHGNENPTLPAVNCDARIMLWLNLRLRKQWHVTTLRLFRCFLFRLLVLLLSA